MPSSQINKPYMMIPDALQVREIRRILVVSEQRLNLTACHQIYNFSSNFDCQLNILIINDRIKAYREALSEHLQLASDYFNYKDNLNMMEEITEMLSNEINITDPNIILYLGSKNSILSKVINEKNDLLMTALQSRYFFSLP